MSSESVVMFRRFPVMVFTATSSLQIGDTHNVIELAYGYQLSTTYFKWRPERPFHPESREAQSIFLLLNFAKSPWRMSTMVFSVPYAVTLGVCVFLYFVIYPVVVYFRDVNGTLMLPLAQTYSNIS
jgi:hypothetical protein